MPIDLHSSLNGVSEYVFGNSVLKTMLGGSISVAFVIAIIIMLIIMVMYPAKRDTPASTLIKMFIYIFLASMTLIFMHDSILKHNINEHDKQLSNDSIMRNATIGGMDVVYGSSYETIKPSHHTDNQSMQHNHSQEREDNIQEELKSVTVGKKSNEPQDEYTGMSIVNGKTNKVLGGATPPKRPANKYAN